MSTTLERFTDLSRRVVILSKEIASTLGYESTGTEHILLGMMLVEDGVAFKVLQSFGVTYENMLAQVEELLKKYPDYFNSNPPFTDSSRAVIMDSLTEALSFGHNYIQTEHLLLALVKEAQSKNVPNNGESHTEELLRRLGIKLDQIRPRMQELFPDIFPPSRDMSENHPAGSSSQEPVTGVISTATRPEVKALVDAAKAKLDAASKLLEEGAPLGSITEHLEGASGFASASAALTTLPEWFPPLTLPDR